jgi:putative flippase GtrA
MLRRSMQPDQASTVTVDPPVASPARRIGRFVVVGCAAAAVHWTGVVWLVSQWGLQPALANVPAWLMAFVVSFVGHHRWTFGDRGAAMGQAAARFLLVSATGFAINEGAYVALLHWSSLRYDLVLAGVLVAVAVLTYLASRHWAFLGNEVR